MDPPKAEVLAGWAESNSARASSDSGAANSQPAPAPPTTPAIPTPSTSEQRELQQQHQQPTTESSNDKRTGEVFFGEVNRPAAARMQKGMEIENEIVPCQKESVRALRKYTTLTNAEIFRRVGVSTSNGYRYLRGGPADRHQDSAEKPKPVMGRKRKLDDFAVSQVIQMIESQPAGEKTTPWEELCKRVGVDVTAITLKRAVESAGYYKCPACQRGKERKAEEIKRIEMKETLTNDFGQQYPNCMVSEKTDSSNAPFDASSKNSSHTKDPRAPPSA